MEQFLSEIRLFAFDFAPSGWVQCNGQLLSINSYEALFALIGTTYGGDGSSTFALPDLRGKVLLNSGNGIPSYFSGGSATQKLTTAQLPKHNHGAVASSNSANINTPQGNFWASDTGYCKDSNASMSKDAIGLTGRDEPHDNMSPYLSMNYCISLTGNYPPDVDDSDYTGIIKPFCNDRRPSNWIPCNGAEYLVTTYPRLFTVIGYTYGGSNNKFNVPNLAARVMIGAGKGGNNLSDYKIGETGGSTEVALTKSQLPKHNHFANAKPAATTQRSDNAIWGNPGRPAVNFYATEKGKGAVMLQNAIQESGEGKAHNNMMPFTSMPFFICPNGEMP